MIQILGGEPWIMSPFRTLSSFSPLLLCRHPKKFQVRGSVLFFVFFLPHRQVEEIGLVAETNETGILFYIQCLLVFLFV